MNEAEREKINEKYLSRGREGAFICRKEGMEKKGNRSIRGYWWEECDLINVSLKGGKH